MTGIAGLRAPALLPVQLRLDGLQDRLTHARQMGAGATADPADEEGMMAGIHSADMSDVAFTGRIRDFVHGQIQPLRLMFAGEPQ
jgi:hypothetical protein